jgi:CheY-like chemotaxis protein/Tfp pilus assembly protein PilZ
MQKKTILIPDDSNIYILLIAIQLRKMGFRVRSFKSADEALSSAIEAAPSMIFIDKGITGMDCALALKELKQNKSTKELPVVVLSSEPTEECREQCLAHGAESYIMMPVSIREMHEILQRCLYLPMGYQRGYLRVCFSGRVMVAHDGIGEWLYSETLSEKGIYIKKKYPYPIGSEVTVSIPLMEEKSISIEGNVVYINKNVSDETGEPSGMAIEFTDKNMDSLVVVSNYVEGLLTIPSVINMDNNISCGI